MPFHTLLFCDLLHSSNYDTTYSWLPLMSVHQIVRRQIPEICDTLVPANSTDLFISRACPAALGCYSSGVAVYEIQPQAPQPNGKD